MALWMGLAIVPSHPAGGQERTVRSYRGLRQENPIPQNQAPQAAQQGLSPVLQRDVLLKQVEKAIDCTSSRQLTAGDYTPWQVVHGILRFGRASS